MFMRLQHRVVISEQVLIRAHAQQRWREWCFKIACVIERACECVFALYADTYTRTHTSHITHTHHTHTSHTHTHTHTHTHICTVCSYIHTYTHTSHAHTHTQTHKHTNTQTHKHITHTHTHAHHTHTHTHTHTLNAAKEEASFAADKAKIITEFFPEGNKTVQVRWGPGKE